MSLFEFILLILFLSWIGGFAFSIGGNLIHALLVLFVLGIIYNWLKKRGSI